MPASTQAVAPRLAHQPALASALRKSRWRILPLLSICYLVAYMDRANISFAAQSMNRDLHFTPRVYGLGAGLFFLSYALSEVPSNALLLRFGARRWLARIMLTWGLLATAMMFVRTPLHFYGARLLLGCAEAGYFPGVLYFLSRWFPGAVRAQTIGLFYIALPISNLVMGGLAGLLLGLNGKFGLAGWQWMFLVEGVPAVVLAFAVWFGLPEDVAGARWLVPAEKAALLAELAPELPGATTKAADHGALRRVLGSSRVWAVGLVYLFELCTLYGLSFSLPTVLRETTGWSEAEVGYLIAGMGIVGAALMLAGAWVSDRSGKPQPCVVVGFILISLGAVAGGLHLRGWAGTGALLLMMLSFYMFQGPMLAVMTMLMPGRASALAIATVNMCGLVGGFLGPYWMGWMRERTGGYAWGIGLLSLPCAVAAVIMIRLTRQPEAN